jgi:hypothetical protein
MGAVFKLPVVQRAKYLTRAEDRSHAAHTSSRRTSSGVFEIRTGQACTAECASMRAPRRAEAAELLALGMRVLRIVDKDVAIALRVSETVVRGLRENTRPFTVGDYIEFRGRLPALYEFIRDAIDSTGDTNAER